MTNPEIQSFSPASRADWRQWLQDNHLNTQSVWLILFKTKSEFPTVSWTELVDEALCFGWIDGQRKPIDDESFKQFFCKRKPKSTWSKINKEKVVKLRELGLMQPAGEACIDIAKKNGSWNILDEAEECLIPDDLQQAFEHYTGSAGFFTNLSRSTRKAMLQWIVLAKQPQTRQTRITEIASLAAQGRKPKQF